MGSRKKLCVFTTEIYEEVSHEILSGILSTASLMNIDITIASIGGDKKGLNFLEEKTLVYKDVFNEYHFNGVIVLAGSMSNFATIDQLKDMLSFIPDSIPVISISVKIPGYNSVIADNSSSVKELVDHLITVHNKKSFMFIKGTKGQSESDQRFEGFCLSLKGHGIEMDNRYIFEGDYSSQAGTNALCQLLDNKMDLPEAIVCVNDDTALGVYAEFKKRSIDFKKLKIAVTGFDNKGYTKAMEPSLTTIDQQFILQGRRAVEAFQILSHGGTIHENNFTPKVKIKESCGCVLTSSSDLDTHDFINFISHHIDDVQIEGLENHINDIADILNKFVEDQEFNIVSKLEDYIARYKYKGYNLNVLSEILTLLNGRVTPSLNRNQLVRFYRSMDIINSNIITSINNEKVNEFRSLNEKNSELDSLLMSLASAMSYKELYGILNKNFYYMGIKSICLKFKESKNLELNKLNNLKFYKDDSLNRSKKFYCNLFLPIETHTEKGYCEMEILLNSFHIGEVLSFQISRALYLIELIDSLNEKINEIEGSYKDLRTAKDLLIKNEKMANIGGLVSGFTHEISSPIGVGVTATSHLIDEVKKINEAYTNHSLRKKDIEHFLLSTGDISKMIISNLERAGSLINGFKQISVDQASEVKREFEMKSYLREIILSLAPILRKGEHKVNVDVKDVIIMNSYPGVISQIITNLVQNSLNHGFEDKKSGNIDIVVRLENDNVIISYKDDGLGIPLDKQCMVFEPYYSTKIGRGGSGLGLSIIKKLIDEKLNGNITCNKDSITGACFKIIFPLRS